MHGVRKNSTPQRRAASTNVVVAGRSRGSRELRAVWGRGLGFKGVGIVTLIEIKNPRRVGGMILEDTCEMEHLHRQAAVQEKTL